MSLPLPVHAVDPRVTTISTRLFGELDVPEEAVVLFPAGLPGFQEARRWTLVETGSADTLWLQSLDEPALVLLLVAVRRISPDAWPQFPQAYAVVTLPGPRSSEATANLRAPVLIDRAARRGAQVIPDIAPWSVTHPFDLGSLIGEAD